MFTLFTFTILCLQFFSTVYGFPLSPRIVFNPPITSPNASTVWNVGSQVTVTWNATGAPAGLTGMAILGFLEGDDDNEHLMLNSPLARDFPLSDAQVTFTVPNVVERNDYILILFGDSGNASPKFSIVGGTSSSAGSTVLAAPTSTASSTTGSPSSTTLITSPIPISGTEITGNPSDTATVTSSSTSVSTTVATVTTPSSPVSTAPSSTVPSSSGSTVSNGSGTAPADTVPSNAAMKMERNTMSFAVVVLIVSFIV